jgi:predicted phage terminase large subunit-like protein
VPEAALVNAAEVESLVAEALLLHRLRADPTKQPWDRSLGETREEAHARLSHIRNDLGAYGEYLHGHTPQTHHRLWVDLIHALLDGTLTDAGKALGLLPPDATGNRNKLLLLAPPASAKSSWCSIALPTWYLGRNPTHNVLFFTSSDPAATGFANTIKILLEHDEKHKLAFPDPAGRPNKPRGWSTDGLYLAGTPMSGQTAAYRAVGWGASVMGQRANLIIIDDPQNQEDAQSAIEQAKAKRYFNMTLQPRLKPGQGAVVSIMTRWHENDLASYFIEKAKESGDWLIVALPLLAEADDPLGREPGEPLWPEQYTPVWVADTQRSTPPAEFAAVYQCSAAQMAGDVFEDERWFKPLPDGFTTPGEGGKSLRDSLKILQATDVAFSEKDRACFTVTLTLGVDRSMNAYILNVLRKRMTVQQTEDAIVEQILLYEPAAVGIEDTAFRHAITAQLVNRIRRRVMANIRAIAPRGMTRGASDKVARARLPAARAEAGQVFADKSASWWPSFIGEVLAFPQGKTSDQVDALSLAMYMALSFRPVDMRPRKLTYNTG